MSASRPLIDERTAWALVRALAPGSAAEGAPARARVSSAPDVWLDVGADGSWTASDEPSAEARGVLDLYLPLRAPADLVMGQLGQSLDGRIATVEGLSHFVTGPKDIERLHRLRALVDAVIVGSSTVAQDDPRLTVRLVDGPDPVRVVLDPSGRLDARRRVLTEPGGRALVVRGPPRGAPEEEEVDGSAGGPTSAGPSVEVLRVPLDDDGFDLRTLVEELRARGLRRILVEGGGVTVSRFLAAGLLDRLHVAVAPLLIGSGRPSITLDPVASLEEALRPACRRFMLGEDVLFDLDFRSRPS